MTPCAVLRPGLRDAATAFTALLALLIGLPGPGAQEAAPPDSHSRLIEAQRLIEAGQTAQAETLLQAIIAADAQCAPAYLSLAELLTSTDRKEQALDVYARLLADADPHNETARTRLRRLFYQGRFPRELTPTVLRFSPVAITVDVCQLSEEGHLSAAATRRLAYTTALLFPESMAGDAPAPWVPLPSSVGGNTMYNRVSYGYVADPDTGTMRARWLLGYPSSTILPSALDYSPLAGRLMHAILRAHIYFLEYFGLDVSPRDGDLLRVFLTEQGPTGAEEFGGRLFFYDVDHDRTPLEWLRETFHELGHLFLPPIGPFPGEDQWANGDLGERLLFQWLLEEAGAVANSPWPAKAASETLDRMWNTGHIPAERYLTDACRLPVNAWLNTTPEDFTGPDALQRMCGFCLWVQAAHGRAVLATVLQESAGSAPADLVVAYKDTIAAVLDADAYRMDAGALNPARSVLLQPVREGAVRRTLITLGEGGHATFRLWLPAGEWALQVEINGPPQAPFLATCDDAEAIAVAADHSSSLGPLAEGWHDLTVTSAGSQPVEIMGLRIRPAAVPSEDNAQEVRG